jgi:hypothetical protein
MSKSQWFGLITMFGFALLYAATAVWCYVGNTVMVGALVGRAFTIIFGLTAVTLASCSAAFVPGSSRDRLYAFAWLNLCLALAAACYVMVQTLSNRWPVMLVAALIALAFAFLGIAERAAKAKFSRI